MSLVRRAAIALGVVLGLGTTAVVCGRVAERGRFVGEYSSYGSGPGGTRALFLLAERLGAAPTRWSEDLARLPEAGGMLVALGGCEGDMARELSRYEASELETWVSSGGVLLVAGARNYLPEALGVHFESDARCGQGWRFMPAPESEGAEQGDPQPVEGEGSDGEPVQGEGPDGEPVQGEGPDGEPVDVEGEGYVEEPAVEEEPVDDDEAYDPFAGPSGELIWSSAVGKPFEGLDPVPMQRPGRLFVSDKADARVVLTAPDAPDMPDSSVQRDMGVVVRHGNGWVIALASASMLQNRALATAEGGVLFARLLRAYAPQGPVLFDEYHLGVGERRSLVRYLRQMGAAPFALQLACVVLLLLWRGGARFGAPRGEPEPPAPGTASYVATMGHLYERAHDPAGAADLIARHALGRVAAHHHLEPAPARKLARLLDDRGDADAAAAVREIGDATRAVGQSGLPRAIARVDAALERALARD